MIVIYNKKERSFTGYKDYGSVIKVVQRPRDVVLGSLADVFEDEDFIFGGLEVMKSSRGGSRGINNLKK